MLNEVKTQAGQAVFEYVLILVVAVTMATLATRLLVSRNPDSPGVITSSWSQLSNRIGIDFPDRNGN